MNDGAASDDAIVQATGIHKSYATGRVRVDALRGVDLTLRRGEMAAIMGPSGCGKTTLLNCLSGLDDLTSGELVIDGTPLASLSDRERTDYRARHMGFVFQFYNLMPVLTSVENVELPLLVARVKASAAASACCWPTTSSATRASSRAGRTSRCTSRGASSRSSSPPSWRSRCSRRLRPRCGPRASARPRRCATSEPRGSAAPPSPQGFPRRVAAIGRARAAWRGRAQARARRSSPPATTVARGRLGRGRAPRRRGRSARAGSAEPCR